MTNNDLEKIYMYFEGQIESCQNGSPDRSYLFEPTWDTLMSLLACIESSYPNTEFHFHRNYFRIEYPQDGEQRRVQDKGSDLKEAVVNCCFKFLSERDKNAPKVKLPNDDFLLYD